MQILRARRGPAAGSKRSYIATYRAEATEVRTIELAVAMPIVRLDRYVRCTSVSIRALDLVGTEDLHRQPYTSRSCWSDGGVYDNLGLETTWKRYETILVSNGGGRWRPRSAALRLGAHAIRTMITSTTRSAVFARGR